MLGALQIAKDIICVLNYSLRKRFGAIGVGENWHVFEDFGFYGHSLPSSIGGFSEVFLVSVFNW